MKNKKNINQIAICTSFVIMILINSLANILPLNGMTTGQLSDLYPNLLVPIGYTFSIWGLIYISLTSYVIYQFKFNKKYPDNHDHVIKKINTYFVISNVLNALWIIAWHYKYIYLSMIIIFLMLVSLILIRTTISQRINLNKKEVWYVKNPFSIYLGWIIVANFLNLIVVLDDLFNGFGIDIEIYTSIFIVLALIVGVTLIKIYKEKLLPVVFIWAFGGILFKHIEIYEMKYRIIISTVAVAMLICVISIITIKYIELKKEREKRKGN